MTDDTKDLENLARLTDIFIDAVFDGLKKEGKVLASYMDFDDYLDFEDACGNIKLGSVFANCAKPATEEGQKALRALRIADATARIILPSKPEYFGFLPDEVGSSDNEALCEKYELDKLGELVRRKIDRSPS